MLKKSNALAVALASVLMASAGTRLAAQSNGSAVTAPSATTLITLGTRGGPLPTADRTQSSNLLVVNGTLYLIDAGDNVTRRIVQAGYDFRKVGKIFITHAHDDHTAGLATLLTSEWEYQRAEPIDIYGGGVEALVKGAIDYLTPNADIRWAEGKKRPMAVTFPRPRRRARPDLSGCKRESDRGREHAFQLSARQSALRQVQIIFLPLRDARSRGLLHRRYRSVRCCGRFGKRRRSLRHRNDVAGGSGRALQAQRLLAGQDPAEQEGFLRHMHEEHVTPEDIGEMATKAGVKAVVMTHLGPSSIPNDDYQRYVDEAKKYYSGPITLAKDLMKF